MKKVVFAALCACALCACATVGTETGSSLFSSTQQPMAVGPAKSVKMGKSCSSNILGLWIGGDMSIEAAKRDGGITYVATVDKDIKNYAVYSKVCIIVTGQ